MLNTIAPTLLIERKNAVLGWSFLGSAAVPSSGFSLNFSRFEVTPVLVPESLEVCPGNPARFWPLLLLILPLSFRECSSVGAEAVCGESWGQAVQEVDVGGPDPSLLFFSDRNDSTDG